MKKKLALLLSLLMVLTCFSFALSACGSAANEAAEEAAEEAADAADTAEEAAVDTFNGMELGYEGDDWAEYAVYQYLAKQIAPQYEPPEGAISLPIVRIVEKDTDEDGDVDISGDFWILNYVIEGDTLKCVSGGAHPGKMELIPVGSGYSVKEFEPVADGGAFESSARDIFEENYDKFMEVQGDEAGREELRAKGIAAYVKTMGLDVTKYQDEGWDPVDIPL